MSSWLSAQLRAAEGLLDAVDKTVSRTVGTLAVAEGDSEATGVAVGEALYGVPRPQPYAAAPLGAGPAFSAAPSAAASGSNAASTHAGAAPAAYAPQPSSAAGGFTVKVDAPIPFGSRPAPQAGAGPSAAPAAAAYPGVARVSRDSSQVSLTPASAPAAPYQLAPAATPYGSNGTSAGGATAAAPWALEERGYAFGAGAATPAEAAAAPQEGRGAEGGTPFVGRGVRFELPEPNVAGGAGQPSAGPRSSVAADLPSGGGGAAASAQAESAAADVAATSGGGGASRPHPAGPSTPGPSSLPPPSQSAPPPPANSSAAPDAGAPAGARGAAGAATDHTRSAPGAAAPASNPPGAAHPAAPSPAPATTAGAPAASAPASAPAAPPPAASSTPNAAAAASTSAAVSAAASTLASATSNAVTHSLSFFNLVMDDPSDPSATDPGGGAAASAGGGGGGGGLQQQVHALSRTCDQLRKRLELSRVENEQLEDMLARAEVKVQQEAAQVAVLREGLAVAQHARAAGEGGLAAQLAVARSSLAEVAGRYEASQRSVLVLEGQLAALEESSRRLAEHHSDREGNIVDALRAELSAAEGRLASERRAHQASRAAAAAREADLEQQVAGNTAALTDLTRSLEDANRKARDLEAEVVEVSRRRNEQAARAAALQRQLEDAGIDPAEPSTSGGGGAPGAEGLMRSPGGARGVAAAAAAELEVLRGEVSAHRRAAQAARQAAEASGAQAAAMAAELEALRQALEQRKDSAQLEAQLREVSDMLYLKQTQLERLASEKAGQQLKTERELENVRQELNKLTRQTIQQGGAGRGGGDGGGPGGGAAHDVIPMDALGEPYQRLARHTKVGKAVKAAANFLDSTASTTSFVLRQYPLARLCLFTYVALVHLYLYMLTARMQRLATHYENISAPAAT